MNFVFWLPIVIGLVGLWFLLAPGFSNLGSKIVNAINKAKKEIKIKYNESEDTDE